MHTVEGWEALASEVVTLDLIGKEQVLSHTNANTSPDNFLRITRHLSEF
jgi:hypothetical protein